MDSSNSTNFKPSQDTVFTHPW